VGLRRKFQVWFVFLGKELMVFCFFYYLQITRFSSSTADIDAPSIEHKYCESLDNEKNQDQSGFSYLWHCAHMGCDLLKPPPKFLGCGLMPFAAVWQVRQSPLPPRLWHEAQETISCLALTP